MRRRRMNSARELMLSMDEKRCVHCPAAADTEDHWFPRSWYPSSTPANLEKWAFPSCSTCNGELGTIEDRLRHRFVLALDPEAIAAQSLVESALRSMNPAHGKSDRDRHARAARRAALERHMFPGNQFPASSMLPGLGPNRDMPLSQQAATGVLAADLERFIAKLVRGLTYLQLSQYLEPTHFAAMYLQQPDAARPLVAYLDEHAVAVDRGPGIRARVAREAREPLTAAYEFVIWERLVVYALSLPVGAELPWRA